MNTSNLDPLKNIPIIDVAKHLGIQVRGNKAMCFGGHDNKTLSLSFSQDKNLWKCFGCDKGGDNIRLVMEVERCDFKSALDWFSRVFYLDVRNNKSYNRTKFRQVTKIPIVKKSTKISPPVNSFSIDSEIYVWLFNMCEEVKNRIGINYLRTHGISDEVAFKYGIREIVNPQNIFVKMLEQWGPKRVFRSGIAWGNNDKPERLIWTTYSLLIPFFENQNINYIQGRLFKSEPKYLNLRGISKPIYNSVCLSQMKKGSVIHICEGVPDVLALASKMINAVGVLGASSFRAEWVDLFIPFEVVLLPDGDKGGNTFRIKITQLFSERGKAVRTITLPINKDVANVVAEMDGVN